MHERIRRIFFVMEKKGYIYLVEDDHSFRESVRCALLTQGYEIFIFDCPLKLMSNLHFQWPAVLVSDVRMPNRSGVELQQDLIDAQIEIPIIFISGESTIQEAIVGMKKGAIDFILKPFQPEKLILSIDKALEKQRIEYQRICKEKKRVMQLAKLAPREAEVSQLMIRGFGNQKIATHLNLSVETVKQYKKNIFRKLDLKDLAGLIRLIG